MVERRETLSKNSDEPCRKHCPSPIISRKLKKNQTTIQKYFVIVLSVKKFNPKVDTGFLEKQIDQLVYELKTIIIPILIYGKIKQYIYLYVIVLIAHINPSMNFNGNTQEAFNFYQSVFGGEFSKIIRFKDIATAEYPVAPHEADKIIYIALPIGSTSLIGNDVPELMGKTNERENRSKIVITVDSKEEAHRIFNTLSVGSEIEVPLGDDSGDSCFAMLRDRYGIERMIDYNSWG
ncbi:MAG TPA: VOC family protein [Candidatus Absconditabacterales bacterium]|nr:VOC family protein [Candidatus Absconditabacterales bacterium]